MMQSASGKTQMYRLTKVAHIALAVVMTFGAIACAAEPLHVNGGAIADVTPDALDVRAFKGIPYAAPPVGGLRWKPPQAVQTWSGLHSSTEWGPRGKRTIAGWPT
jgi:para-nitrobenzyl esterase